MHVKQLTFDFSCGNGFHSSQTFAFTNTEKNDDFTAFFDAIIDKLIHRHDFQSVCAPSEAGRFRSRIAQSNDTAPECLFWIWINHAGFDIETVFSRCNIDAIRGRVHIFLYDGVFNHRVGCNDMNGFVKLSASIL